MPNRTWLWLMLSGAVITVAAAAVVVVGAFSKTPWGDLSINLATMIVGALLAASLAAVKRYADRLPKQRSTSGTASGTSQVAAAAHGDLTPLAPARIAGTGEHGFPDTVTFNCNHDKAAYWGLVFLSLFCVVGTVAQLFNPELRTAGTETGQPLSDWVYLGYANAAVLFAYLFVPIAVLGLSMWQYRVRLDVEGSLSTVGDVKPVFLGHRSIASTLLKDGWSRPFPRDTGTLR
ncbi:hypothetical protein LO763_22040 [Glycomyces sp. A-F 0318]|uniref:hypothetical protein n=1 Tax=Glycomyces amatae TaxID=2881355 RepID=UPI001E56DB17|nr:hypothetical protein [Glycomyces amatae]MCD0446298.1 hypothetical protein [Glycomyces amatae]